MDGSLLVERNTSIERAVGAEEVHVGLSVVALVGLVYFCLCQHNQAGAQVVPLELDLITLEKGLLRNRASKLRNVVYLDGSGLTLFGENTMLDITLPFRKRVNVKTRHTLRTGTKTATFWFWPGAIAK